MSRSSNSQTHGVSSLAIGTSLLRALLPLCVLLLAAPIAAGTASGDEFCISTDLADWQYENPLPDGQVAEAVDWIPSRSEFVAMGDAVLTSADGSSWTVGHRFGAWMVQDYAWSDNEYIAVTFDIDVERGTILRSPDLLNWSEVESALPALFSVAWGGSAFVAVGDGELVRRSNDGIIWTEHSTGAPSNVRFTAVEWIGSQFIAVGSGSAMFTSTDGVTWTELVAPTSGRYLWDVAWTGSDVVVSGAMGELWISSDDGASWDTTRLLESDFYPFRVAHTGGRTYAYTDDLQNSVFSSDNLLEWPFSLNAVPFADVASNGTDTVAVGRFGQRWIADQQWNWLVGEQPVADEFAEAITALDGVVLVGTVSGSIARSTDGGATFETTHSGTSWARRVAANDDPSDPFYLAQTIGNYWSSPDGVNWMELGSTFLHHSLQGVNGHFFARVSSGIITSEDGSVWTQFISNDGSGEFTSVAFNDGNWIAVGTNGIASTSTNFGATWSARSTGTTADLRDLASAEDKVYAVGPAEALLVSSNGGTSWSMLEAPADPWAIAGLDGELAMVGGTSTGGDRLYFLSDAGIWSLGSRLPATSSAAGALVGDSGRWLYLSETVARSVAGPVWEPQREPTSTGSLRDVAAIGQTTVVVAGSDDILTTTDGSIWQSVPLPQSRTLITIASSDDLFVAAGSGGTRMTSTDGLNWTDLIPTGGIEQFTFWDVAHGDAGFVIVSGTNLIWHSVDGVSWFVRTAASGASLLTVGWSGDRYVAVGQAGELVTSLDGVVWQQQPLPVPGFFGKAAFAQKQNLSLLVGWFGRTWVSADRGVNWAVGSLYDSQAASFFHVDLVGSEFVALQGAEFATSSDGVNWTNHTALSGARHYALTTALDENFSETVVVVTPGGIVQRAAVNRACDPLPPSDILLRDGFESGDTSAWQ